MKNIFQRQNLVNVILVCIIVFVTLSIMLVSFAAKAVRYDENAGTVSLNVEKKQYKVTAQTIGTVSRATVSAGQHVKKGDELVEITNVILDKQIALLEQLYSTNASASVELVNLKTQKEAQKMYAPTDGVIAEIANEGEAINTLQTVAIIYSDSNVSLVGQFKALEYDAVQQSSGGLVVRNDRLRATYPVQYAGTRQVVETRNNPGGNITLAFVLQDPEDAASMLQNERIKLELTNDVNSTKPIDKFIEWYRDNLMGLSATE